MNISNSLMNAYADYKNEALCGLQFKAVYVDKTHETEQTDVMKLGQWFEYLCTGTLPRSGEVPTGPTLKNGSLSTDGQRVELQKKNFNKLYKGKAYAAGNIILHEYQGHTFKAIFDVLEYEPDAIEEFEKTESGIAIRDLKLTAAIDDKWNDFGWVNIENKKHINQAKFYIWIYWKKFGRVLPFYFDVFSSKDERNFKVIKVTMTVQALFEFEAYLLESVKMLDFDIETGFIYHPDLMMCAKCPLSSSCEFFTDLPNIELIEL